MAVGALSRPRVSLPWQVRARVRPVRLPIENTLIWAGAFAFYITFAAYAVFHLHFMINDALTRTDNAFDVLYSRDPHLGAIGFSWPPLPSFLQLPLLAFKGLWPPLATQGFAGSIEAAAFSAGSVVLVNVGLRWAGVVRGMRAVLCLLWMINPMIVIYGTQGMSEATFIFFFLASVIVFLRWSENRRASLLPLAGILAGCAALCRVEAILVAFLMGYCVLTQAIQNRAGWRRAETQVLLYALPAALVIGLWLVTAAILFHDPLYVVHAYGLFTQPTVVAPIHATHAAVAAHAAAAAAATNNAYGVVSINSWKDAATTVANHMLDICPAVAALGALLIVQIVARNGRVARSNLLVLGLAIPAFDVLQERVGTSPLLRYQIVAIPFAFLLAIQVLRAVRGKRALISSITALGMAVVLALSNLVTAQTLSNPSLAEEEWPVMRSVVTGQTVDPSGDYGALAAAPGINAQLLKLDWDRGLILCDSATCFALNVTAPDPKLFVVTSDRNFEAAAANPRAYQVEYFLVPKPEGAGAIDRLNGLYPSLWQNGGGFATLIGEGRGGGPMLNWRLYRISGSTGRSIRIPR